MLDIDEVESGGALTRRTERDVPVPALHIARSGCGPFA
jgi:hypothetical protein